MIKGREGEECGSDWDMESVLCQVWEGAASLPLSQSQSAFLGLLRLSPAKLLAQVLVYPAGQLDSLTLGKAPDASLPRDLQNYPPPPAKYSACSDIATASAGVGEGVV